MRREGEIGGSVGSGCQVSAHREGFANGIASVLLSYEDIVVGVSCGHILAARVECDGGTLALHSLQRMRGRAKFIGDK